jgi:hypothetical protein
VFSIASFTGGMALKDWETPEEKVLCKLDA